MPDDLRYAQSTAETPEPHSALVSALSDSLPPATETPKPARRWLTWRHAKLWGKKVIAITTTLSTLLVAGWFLYLLGEATSRRHILDLTSITVSKKMADDGFTSQGVTRRLREAINAVQDRANTSMVKNKADVPLDMSAVTIPKVGISVESMAASIRTLLPQGWQHEIAAEFTTAGDRLHLQLWVNDRTVFSGAESGAEAMTKLIDRGAFQIVEATQPYIAALALFETDIAASQAAADRIIASYPPNDEIVARAINLKGNIAREENRTNDAIIQYKNAIHLDQNFAIPHLSLGLIWAAQGKTDEAISEYQTAIRLDPKLAFPHNNLGLIWAAQGKTEDAIGEYQTTIRLDPKYALPHNNLGLIWAAQGKTEDAIGEYQTAIHLNPKREAPHYNLGQALRQAAATAAEADRPKLLSDACMAFTQGAALAPNDPDYPARIREVDADLHGTGHCPPQ
jgi:tetratricopeptide (TPR) repeat protein